MATVLPPFWAALHDLAAAHRWGEWRSWPEAETAVNRALSPDIMAKVETAVPGWQQMAAHEDGQTLVHVCSVFVALLGSDYYRRGTEIERNLWEWVTLLHDLAKAPQPGKRDLTHAFRSAAQAVRILPGLGFPVQAAYGQMVDDWVALVETAVCPTPVGLIQDNGQLPAILDGIARMFGADGAAVLVLKTILLHHSFSPIPAWPNPAALTDAEVRAFISPPLWRLLGPFLAFDSAGWDMYEAATRPLHTAQVEACVAHVAQLLSS
ncbi:MAG: hypothetical protein KF770_18555 [Anaerolineae bacterium]|nr:hypothetical protein [Anaerolineae bacterium]